MNFSDKQEFTGIQQEFYRNSTGIQIEFLKIGKNIRLCYTYSRHLIFTGIQNYRNSIYRNSPEFTGIHRNSTEFTEIHRDSRIPVCPIKFTVKRLNLKPKRLKPKRLKPKRLNPKRLKLTENCMLTHYIAYLPTPFGYKH